MTEPDQALLSSEVITALLAHLGLAEGASEHMGRWQTPPDQMPYFAYSAEAEALIEALQRSGLLLIFDWTTWRSQAPDYENQPELVAQADLLTLRRLLTMHVRAERFNEGHLAHIQATGHLAAILHRLTELRRELPSRGHA